MEARVGTVKVAQAGTRALLIPPWMSMASAAHAAAGLHLH